MNATPQTRAAPKPHRTRGWWLLLAFTGGISLLFNVWYAVDPPTIIATDPAQALALAAEAKNRNQFLGVITGVIPVVLAAWLSHDFQTGLLGRWERAVIILVFIGAMGMSIVHQAELLKANLGPYWCWVLPAMVDAVALLALRAINIASRLNREAAEAADIVRDMEALKEALRPEVEADIRARLEADMPRFRAKLEADIRVEVEADMSAKLSDIESDMEARKEADIEARLSDMLPDIRADIERQVRRELSGRTKRPQRALTAAKPEAKAELTSEERDELARKLLAKDPDMSGAKLAAALGVTERTGQRIRSRVGGPASDMSDADDPDMSGAASDSMSDSDADMSDGSGAVMSDARARLRAV